MEFKFVLVFIKFHLQEMVHSEVPEISSVTMKLFLAGTHCC